MTIYYLQFDEALPDVRCSICKQHKYMIKCVNGSWTWIHTYIDQPQTDRWIHSWNPYDFTRYKPALCIQSFKEVKKYVHNVS